MEGVRKRIVEQKIGKSPDPIPQDDSQRKKSTESASKWTSSVRSMLSASMIVGFVLRFFMVNEPAEVVFDEVHFGGFASAYIRREYFFDIHPPLGKLMIAAVGKLFGYDGSFTFANIGLPYATTSVPYVVLRSFMIVLSMASIGFSIATLVEMGFSLLACTLASALMVFDNALIIQSRLVLLDSPLIFFISMAIWGWVKFRQQRAQSFTKAWWGWLLLTGAAIGCATSVKMVGMLTVLCIGVATLIDLWELSDWRRKISDRGIRKHFAARVFGLIVVPIAIFLACYYIHFALLIRTGPGDLHMSPAFQSNLEGNPLGTKSRVVRFGSTIRLKSRLEMTFLHSHPHNYPFHHEDGKVSSQGQQVTGYPSGDNNNLWKILPAKGDASHSDRNLLRNGSIFRLLHVNTGKVLFTHDVASPLTRTNMEITVVDPNDESKYNSTLWKIDVRTKQTADVVMTMATTFRIIHLQHNVFLNNHEQPLPSWGFNHREINGDKRGVEESCKWIVWEIADPISKEEQAEIASRPHTPLSFWDKLTELITIQILSNASLVDKHPYRSAPIIWPFVIRGVSYWDKNKTNRIYLLGNPLGWLMSISLLAAIAIVAARKLYEHHRHNPETQSKAVLSADRYHLQRWGYLLLTWSLHYLPFFLMVRSLYLHHYLPAFMQSAMLAGAAADYAIYKTRHPRAIQMFIGLILVGLVCIYLYMSPLIYGTYKPTAELRATHRWLSTWDLP